MADVVTTNAEALPNFIPYVEVRPQIEAYAKRATVTAQVAIDRAHFDEGRQWGHKGDIVKLTPEDAKILDRLGHVVIDE